MNTGSSCRHWRPIHGSLTEMVCSLIRSNSQHPVPRIVLDLIRQKPTDHPMILATPADFGLRAARDGTGAAGPSPGLNALPARPAYRTLAAAAGRDCAPGGPATGT